MKPSEIPTKELSEDSLSVQQVKITRYSGIAERVILLMPGQFITEGNHKKQGYKKMAESQ